MGQGFPLPSSPLPPGDRLCFCLWKECFLLVWKGERSLGYGVEGMPFSSYGGSPHHATNQTYACVSLYPFLKVAVTNCHRSEWLKPQAFILLQFWSEKSEAEVHVPLKAPGESPPASSAPVGCRCPWPWQHHFCLGLCAHVVFFSVSLGCLILLQGHQFPELGFT